MAKSEAVAQPRAASPPASPGSNLKARHLQDLSAESSRASSPQPASVSSSSRSPSPSAGGGAASVSAQTWRDEDTHVEVLQPPDGFNYQLECVARVALPPDEVYGILTSPHNHQVFKSIKEIKNRRVLKDENGRQVVEQEQVGRWRLGLLKGVFSSHLEVTQDSHSRTVFFKLRKPGVMRDFAGSWEVQPFDDSAIDQFVNHRQRPANPMQALQASFQRLEQRMLGKQQASQSLVRLSQSLAPAMVPPPPLNRMMGKMAAKQVFAIMQDLRAEADRRNKANNQQWHER